MREKLDIVTVTLENMLLECYKKKLSSFYRCRHESALVLDFNMDISNSLECLHFVASSTKLTFMSTKTSEALL